MDPMIVFIINVVFCSIVVAVHLDRRVRERERVGDITKCFLIPSLYLTLFTASKAFPREIYRPELLFLIAFFYTLGDILLLKKTPTWRFLVGALSFICGHIVYIIYFSHFGLNIYTLLGGMILFGIPLIYLILKIIKSNPKYAVGYIIYGLTLYFFGVGMSAVFSFKYLKTSILVFIGVWLFIYSYSRIALNSLLKDGKNRSFMIMLTYIAANLFLVLGVWCINVPLTA
mgnify:FL=1